jgi:RNA polymerase sigma-70 factor (ECF subfamily)
VRLAARITGSVEDGEDVVQEAYVKAHRALVEGRFDRRSRIETWLYRIVANSAIDALRAGAKRPRASDTIPEPAWDGVGAPGARRVAEARCAPAGTAARSAAAIVLKASKA